MIYEYKKYKDIDSFVNNCPKNNRSEQFTLVHKCKGITFDGDDIYFNPNCFGCLFCALNSLEIKNKFMDFWGADLFFEKATNAFKGNKVSVPSAKKILRNPNKNLESFTSKDETSNIQPWATGILNSICSTKNRISMEIPIFNPNYDRNGRLDICSITDKYLITMESKITLDDALADERFVEQQEKYTSIIEQSTDRYLYLTLIGGNEGDLFPPNSFECTGRIGNKTQRFYELIDSNKIRFISANALWLLACKYMIYGKQYSWDIFLTELFENENCIGLLSAGMVMKENNQYVVKGVEND